MATLVHAPDPYEPAPRSVFLAGSIEMGTATDWQSRVAAALDDFDDLLVLNPRRPSWDASWEQSIDNPQFREQVEWELEGLERCDVIAMYLDPATRAPVSLLELGLHARSGKLVVLCPPGYWRKGNVEVVAQRHGIDRYETWAPWIEALRQRLG